MTSKRTRSGIPFGYGKEKGKSENGRSLNQLCLVSDSSMVKTKYSNPCSDKTKLKGDHKINDLTKLLYCGDDKDNSQVNPHKSLTCKSQSVLDSSKNVECKSSSGRSGYSDKSEILVSLLGGNTSHADKPNKYVSSPSASSKLLEVPKASEEKVIQPRKGKDRKRSAAALLDVHDCPPVSHPSIRIFSNSNPKASTEVLNISNVPCETFLVSLSKDKNKELNMVKTTTGTRHVNSSQSQFLSKSNYNFQDSFAKHASQSSGKCTGLSEPMARKCKNEDYDIENDSKLHAEVKVILQSELQFHDNKDVSCKDDRYISDPPTASNHFVLKPHKSPIIDQNDTKVDLDGADIVLADILNPEYDYTASMNADSLTSHIGSQFPLMEKILTHQSHKENIPDVSEDSSDHQAKNSMSLLKTSIDMTKVQDPKLDCSHSTFLKRSERLRCRTETKPHGSSVTTQQTVISTMKSATYKCKLKGLSSGSKKKKKSSLSKVSKKHKKEKNREESKSRPRNKSSDVSSKIKHVMSREVMDGIVKSIEETVSKVNNEEELFAAPDLHLSNATISVKSLTGGKHREKSVIGPKANSYLLKEMSNNVSHNLGSNKNSTQSLSCKSEDKKIIKKDKSLKKNKVITSKASSTKAIIKSVKGTKTASICGKNPKPKSQTEDEKQPAVETPKKNAQSLEVYRQSSSQESTPTDGKRFRKKTRKAEEALGDKDVFSDEDLAVKRSKSKKRQNNGQITERSNSSSQKSRRSSKMHSILTDPVIGEHAFILWASEHRSEAEQAHPDSNVAELDSLLATRWSLVPDNAKMKFFLRARDAISDEDRCGRPSNSKEIDMYSSGPSFLAEFPDYCDFVLLPEESQRDLLRKWLKFFQKILPKSEYSDFISGFKRACGREKQGEARIRTRMKCLDPAHFKALYNMIRLSKSSVIKMYRENRGQERKDTYSVMLRQLIAGDSWPHLKPECHSTLLTQLLEDLKTIQLDDKSTAVSGTVSHTGTSNQAQALFTEEDFPYHSGGSANVAECKELVSEGAFVPLEDWECQIFSSDLASSLLEELHHKTGDLPILDQKTLDQVFLAPPTPTAITPTPALPPPPPQQSKHNKGGHYTWRSDTSARHTMNANSSSSFAPGPTCSARSSRYIKTEMSQYPRISFHHPSNNMSASGVLAHHHPTTSLAPYPLRQGVHNNSISGMCQRRKESPMDMHSYSISMDNVLHCASRPQAPVSRCLNIHKPSSAPLPHHHLQGPAVPCPTQVRFQAHNNAGATMQQQYSQSLSAQAGNAMMDPAMSSKLNPHHMYPMNSPSGGSTSRLYQGSMGSSGPLITSLSPLRTSKAGGPIKTYSPHCQMMPYRQHLHTTSIGGQSFRKTHKLPLSNLKPTSVRGQSNLQQIKVCLPTQGLKIPIAKLRGGRKAPSSSALSTSTSLSGCNPPHIKSKIRNVPVSSHLMDVLPVTSTASVCSVPSGHGGRSQHASHSVLAKVLGLHGKYDNDLPTIRSAPTSSGHLCPLSTRGKTTQMPTSFLSPKNAGEAQHVSMYSTGGPLLRPVGSSTGFPVGTHLHDMRSGVNIKSTSQGMSTSNLSQTAVVISPLQVHRRATTSYNICTASMLLQSSSLTNTQSSSMKSHVISTSQKECTSTVSIFTGEFSNISASQTPSLRDNSIGFFGKKKTQEFVDAHKMANKSAFDTCHNLKSINARSLSSSLGCSFDQAKHSSDCTDWSTFTEPVVDNEFCESLVNLNPSSKTVPADDSKQTETDPIIASNSNDSRIEQKGENVTNFKSAHEPTKITPDSSIALLSNILMYKSKVGSDENNLLINRAFHDSKNKDGPHSKAEDSKCPDDSDNLLKCPDGFEEGTDSFSGVETQLSIYDTKLELRSKPVANKGTDNTERQKPNITAEIQNANISEQKTVIPNTKAHVPVITEMQKSALTEGIKEKLVSVQLEKYQLKEDESKASVGMLKANATSINLHRRGNDVGQGYTSHRNIKEQSAKKQLFKPIEVGKFEMNDDFKCSSTTKQDPLTSAVKMSDERGNKMGKSLVDIGYDGLDDDNNSMCNVMKSSRDVNDLHEINERNEKSPKCEQVKSNTCHASDCLSELLSSEPQDKLDPCSTSKEVQNTDITSHQKDKMNDCSKTTSGFVEAPTLTKTLDYTIEKGHGTPRKYEDTSKEADIPKLVKVSPIHSSPKMISQSQRQKNALKPIQSPRLRIPRLSITCNNNDKENFGSVNQVQTNENCILKGSPNSLLEAKKPSEKKNDDKESTSSALCASNSSMISEDGSGLPANPSDGKHISTRRRAHYIHEYLPT